MIKDKKFLYISLILILTSMALNFPFPNENYFDAKSIMLNITISTIHGGFRYIGIASLVLLILGLYFLGKSLEKYHVGFIVIALIIASILPPLLAKSLQKTFATGIYAINYERDKSDCRFDMTKAITLHGVCKLPFENYSKKGVQFTVELHDELEMLSIMNKNAHYDVKLSGKESKVVKFETEIDVSKMKKHIGSGQSTDVNIIIKSGNKSRKL